MDIHEILKKAINVGGSDIHLTVGAPPVIRVDGELKGASPELLTPEDTKGYAKTILNEENFKKLLEHGDADASYERKDIGRFRVNAFMQKGSVGIVMRTINTEIPSMEKLGLPEVIRKLCNKKRGLILVTGPTGSGKSTTLASMIDYINQTKGDHIITIEDPIEYLHKHKKSIVNQREVGDDTDSFASALRASLREDPDIILVGELRDLETIQTAVTAAETGHLVLSTLHTIGAAKTIDRIIDAFPPHQQQQIRVQVASVLEAVISQQLLPAEAGGRVAAFEIMTTTSAIKNLIREAKVPQMQNSIQTSRDVGMITMDTCLKELYQARKVSRDTALKFAVSPDALAKEI